MNMTRRRIEGLRDALRRSGLDAAILEYKHDCAELALRTDDGEYFVYIYPGRFAEVVIAKLTWKPGNCRDALLDPEGLIAIGEDEAGLAVKIKAKIDRLKTIARAAKSI